MSGIDLDDFDFDLDGPNGPELDTGIDIRGSIVVHLDSDSRIPPGENAGSSDGDSPFDPRTGGVNFDGDGPLLDEESRKNLDEVALRSLIDPGAFTVWTSDGSTNAYWTEDNEIVYSLRVSNEPGNRLLSVSYDGPKDGAFSVPIGLVTVSRSDLFRDVIQGPTFHFNCYPEVELTASPSRIDFSESATLTWRIHHFDSAKIDNGVGLVGSTGSVEVSPDRNVTYTLTADGPAGSRSDDTSVSINPPRIDPFYADATGVWSGNATTVHWETTNANSVTLSSRGLRNDLHDERVARDGSRSVTPVDDGARIELTVSGPGGGPKTREIEFTVNHEPSARIWADDGEILRGKDTTLHWRTAHAHEVEVTNVGSNLAADGDTRISPLRTRTYKLTATGDRGATDTDRTTVRVKQELRETSTISLTHQGDQRLSNSGDPYYKHEYKLGDVSSILATHGIAGSYPTVEGVESNTDYNGWSYEIKRAAVFHDGVAATLPSSGSIDNFDRTTFPGTWKATVWIEGSSKPTTFDLDVEWVHRP